MNYQIVQQQFADWPIVSVREIQKAFPTFDKRRLVEWQQKGYLDRLTNGWYRFVQFPVSESLLWWVANRMYQPSYISLETALSYHGLIPEGVFSITSISTRKTRTITNKLGTFTYRTVKPTLYFGYNILRWQDRPILIADLEKALLDLCYLRPDLQHPDDFAQLRLNAFLLAKRLRLGQLAIYQQLFANQRLNQRVDALTTYIQQYAHA